MAETFIFKQLQQALSDSESWKPDHDEAMLCRDLEERISYALWVREWIGEEHDKLPRRTVETEICLVRILSVWFRFASNLSDFATDFEAKGYPVDGIGELRRWRNDLAPHMADLQRAESRLSAVVEGRGMTLSQAMHVLRTHHCA